ncbi:Lrrc56 [Symbiodinium sp. CCMP2592]|nr:Lrrc56 [Symbiodinium sp. CCMP2592]
MAGLWKHISNVATWACEPSRSEAFNDEVMQLKAVLDETRLRLHHEERVNQELKAQIKEEQRRGHMRQRELREQLELQHEEIQRLLSELETAKAAASGENKAELHELGQKSDAESHSREAKARASETELLAALLEHATKQATACAAKVAEESTVVQQLREELEAARGKASEEQEAAQALRQELQQEKAARVEMEGFLIHRRACEADVANFLRLLGQRYPELAGATRLLFDPRTQAEHQDTALAASPRDADFPSERGDISERSRPSRSPSPEEEIPDDASELSEDFLRRLCQGADLEDVEALEIRVDSTRQSLQLLGQCFPNLKRLRLSESSILCVRELGSHLAKLQVLWLGRCGLQDLDGLTLLEGLRELYLPFNDVVDVALPKWLDHLQVLDLEGNAVEDPDDLAELAKCYALRDLTIRGNPVTFLPGFSRRTFFDQMPSLEFLDDLPNFPDLPLQADLPCEESFDGDAERFLDRYLACDLDLYMDLYLQEPPQADEEGFASAAVDDESLLTSRGQELCLLMTTRVLPGGLVLIVPFHRQDVQEDDVKAVAVTRLRFAAFLTVVARLCAWIKVRLLIQLYEKYAAWMESDPKLKDSLH